MKYHLPFWQTTVSRVGVGLFWVVFVTCLLYYAATHVDARALAQETDNAADSATGLEPAAPPMVEVVYSASEDPALLASITAPIMGTVADNFDNGSGGSTGFTGSDGSLSWLGNWQNSSQVFVQSFSSWCKSGYCLRMYGNRVTATSSRQANLSGVISATLTFDYGVYENSNGSARVEVSNDGVTYQLLGALPAQYPATAKSYAIPAANLTAGFRLRFVATNSNTLTDLFVDNLVITLFGGTPPSTATATGTFIPTATGTHTPTATRTSTPTATATATLTPTATATNAATATNTPTPTALGTPPAIQTIEVRVAQGADDVEESVASGTVDSTSSDLELVNDPGTTAGIQKIGLRFNNLQIPGRAYISRAYIEFEVDEAQSAATNLTLRAQDSDNAAAFGSTAYNVSSRTVTAASVDWSVPAWATLNVKQQSPDIASVIQAVVNRAGWSSGNSMVFVINGSGQRTAKSYNLAAASAPLLHIEYSAIPIVANDLIAGDLEVTQAIQDLNHSVRLVKDKRTFVRFYARTDQGKAQVPAQLEVQRGAQSTILLPVNGDATYAIGLTSTSSRAVLAGSFLFELPAGFREGSVTLTGRLNPQATVGENNASNNSRSVTVNFEVVPPIDLLLYNIGYGANYYATEFDLSMLESWLRRVYPISELRVTRRTIYYGSSRPSCDQVRARLGSDRTTDVAAGTVSTKARYYGMVTDKGGFMRGCGWQYTNTGPTGVGNYAWDTDGTYGDWYGGHELGHGYLRDHANFCGASGGPAYPYPNGRISPVLTGAAAIYGFDAGNRAIYGPEWTDIMTYCAQEWISDFTYEAIMSNIQNGLVTAATDEQARFRHQTDRLLIVGDVVANTGETTLEPIFLLPQVGEVEERIPGDYAIVLQDGTGLEVARYPFTPQRYHYGAPDPTLETLDALAVAEPNLLGIHELVPSVEGVTSVEIWGPSNTLLSRVVAQLGQPALAITAPRSGQIEIGDTLEVAWSATEPDGEALVFNLQYSVDQGKSWESVAGTLTEPHFTVELRHLRRGDDLRFRVWASDGIHTSIAEMATGVVLPSQPVTAKISAPDPNTTLSGGQPVLFQGSGYALDSGYLTGEALRWFSDRDGQIGVGETFSTTTLSVGTHTIELRALGQQESSGSDSVQVTIVEAIPDTPLQRVFLPVISNQ